ENTKQATTCEVTQDLLLDITSIAELRRLTLDPEWNQCPIPNVQGSLLLNAGTPAGDFPVPLRTLYLSFQAQI
ncbi:hypothetical protein ACQP3J_30760, partial [Escherichia coli]